MMIGTPTVSSVVSSGYELLLLAGDIIRIYHFMDEARDIPELQFVKVLSVTDSRGVNIDNTKEATEEEEKLQSATITVLASPEQAKLITAMENDGVAHVALISRGNDTLAGELLSVQEQVLMEIYHPEELQGDTPDETEQEPSAIGCAQ